MKLIHKFKSLNFNERRSGKISLIIIHYTALDSISESIDYLCKKKNKVSSHYLISKKGEVSTYDKRHLFSLIKEFRLPDNLEVTIVYSSSILNSSSIAVIKNFGGL